MPRLLHPTRLLVATTFAVICALLVPATAHAAGAVSTTGTTTATVRLNQTTALTGLSVTDTDSSDVLQVTLSTDLGTIALPTTTGLTLDYGYSSFSGPVISFTGSPAAVNTAVGNATITTTSTSGTAHISLSALVSAPGYVYSPTNGHYYKFVANSGVSYWTALSDAQGLTFHGQPGYLATMPTAATNDVVANRISGANNAWIAAKSTDSAGSAIQRTWKWDAGPVAGRVISYCSNFAGVCDLTNNTGLFSSWAAGEPNNSGSTPGSNESGEFVGVTNYQGTHGAWNDLKPTDTPASGYVVEFGDRVNGATGFVGVSTSNSSVRVESPPAAPTGVTAVRGNQSAQVSFTAGADNGSPITGYTVSATTGGTSTTTTCYLSPCTVPGLTNGSSYTFTVTATNAVGTSAASAASAAVTPAAVPNAPSGVTAARGNQQATLTFTIPAGNGSPITGYTAKASTGGVRTTSSCSTSPCTVTGLTNGTAYVFTLIATNAVGDSPASEPSDSVVPAGSPAAPTAASAVRGNQSAQISFTPGSANGNPITTYTATSSPGGVSGTCSASPCNVAGLTNGTAYTFAVTATNAIGTSAAATATAAVTPAAVPDSPTGVSAIRGDQQASVSFVAPTGNGTAITGYTVTASTGGVRTTSACSTSPCTVTGLTNGTAYVFTVTATNAVGTSPASDPSDAVTPAGAPSGPTATSAVRGNQSAQVAFTPGSANGSPVTAFTATSSPGGLTGTCTASPCTVTGLTNGTAYTFTVAATNQVGTSAASTATAAVTPAAVPNPPTQLSATRGNQQASVAFTPPAMNGTAITGYTVTASTGGVRTTSACSTSPCTVTGLTNGTAYVFTVTATNAVGVSPASDPSDAVTPAAAPAPPTTVSAVRGNQSAQVSFTAGSANGSPITAFTATSSPGGLTGACATSPCNVTGLVNGTAYTFTVTATNAVGTSTASTASAAVTPAAVPNPPTQLSATRGNQQAVVTFTAPAGNGTAITGYTVAATTGATTTTSACSTSPCTVTGLTNGSPYVFTVKATNGVGASPASDPSNAVTPAGVPSSPTGISAVRGDQSAQVSFTTGADNGSPITGFTATSSPGGLIGSCTTNPCTVTGLTNGTAYTFRVSAANAIGTSAASTPSAAVTPAAVPGAPVDLGVVSQDAGVAVSFGPPVSDGGSAISRYEFSIDDGQTWTTLVTTGTTTLTASITGLVNGTAYGVRVRAVNAVADGANVVSSSVTPARAPGAVSGPAAAVTGTTATVTWAAPADDGGAPIVSYVVTSVPASTTCTTATTSCTVVGLTPGTSYVFSVHADNTHSSQPSTGPGPETDADPVSVSAIPGSPTTLTVQGSNRSLQLTFAPAIAPVTGYQLSLDGGRSWSPLTTTGAGLLSATVTPVLNGQTYAVQVRAMNHDNPGASTAVQSVTVDQWFADPVTRKTRATQVQVPQQLQSTVGPRRHTVATNRSAGNEAVTSMSALSGRQLQAGQGVQVPMRQLFRGTTKKLTPTGRARLTSLARSLAWVDGLTCEGYTDYSLQASVARKLSAQRARVVCKALTMGGVAARMVAKGYGGTRPQIIGGEATRRRANNRIVLVATDS